MNKLFYIIKEPYEVKVRYENKIVNIGSCYSFLNQLAQKNLFTLEGYRKQIRKQLAFRYLIPIYFNHKLLLFPLTDNLGYQFWINYMLVKDMDYQNGKLAITFDNKEKISMQVSKAKVTAIMAKVYQLIDYINNV